MSAWKNTVVTTIPYSVPFCNALTNTMFVLQLTCSERMFYSKHNSRQRT